MKKGFTLIELLAVIVILAIIALIATPIVLNIIDDTRDETQKISVKNYAKAVDLAIVKKMQKNNKLQLNDEYYVMSGKSDSKNRGNVCLSNYNKIEDTCETILEIELDGEYPIEGKITISQNKVKTMSLVFKSFKANMYKSGDITITTDTIVGICETVSGNINSLGSQVKCGDEYFYIIKVNSETVSMLAFQNITLTSTPRQSSSAESIKEADYYKDYLSPYATYLQSLGLTDVNVEFPSADLITQFSNVETDGCYLFPSNYNWIYDTNYWVDNFEYGMDSGRLTPNSFYDDGYDLAPSFGIRPLVTIYKSEID